MLSILDKNSHHKTVNKIHSEQIKITKPPRKNVRQKRKIPWDGLLAIAITYAIMSFILANLTLKISIWLFYFVLAIFWGGAVGIAMAWTETVAWAVAVFWALVVALAWAVSATVAWIGSIAGAWVGVISGVIATTVIGAVAWVLTSERLKSNSFNIRDRFLILFLASSFGIGIGSFTWYFYSLFN